MKFLYPPCYYFLMAVVLFVHCQAGYRRLLYDKVENFIRDSLVSTDLINTSAGYEYPLLKNDSITLVLRLNSIIYNQNISFDARINESGEYEWKKLNVSVVFPDLK